jgi:hypothetical protein
MALFSRRFWNSVIQLDKKVTAASATCDSAIRRFRVSRKLIVDESRMEFHHDVCESLAELRIVVRELREFQDRHASSSRVVTRDAS